MSALLLGLLFWRVGGRQQQTPAHTAAHLQTAGADGAPGNTSAIRGQSTAHEHTANSC